MDFTYALGGIVPISTTDHCSGTARRDRELGAPWRCCRRRITLDQPIFAEAFAFLRDTVGQSVAKITIPSLNVHATIVRGSIVGDVYDDEALFWDDLIAAYARSRSPGLRSSLLHLPADRRHVVCPYQRPGRAAPGRGGGWRPAPRARAIHRASQSRARRSPRWHADHHPHVPRQPAGHVALKQQLHGFVAEALFNELHVDGFFLEFDDARSGSFRPAAIRASGATRSSCSDWSRPSAPSSSRRTSCCGESTRPRSTWSSTSCACRRSAGSPPRRRATR